MEVIMPDEMLVTIVGVLGPLIAATIGAYWLLNRQHGDMHRKH